MVAIALELLVVLIIYGLYAIPASGFAILLRRFGVLVGWRILAAFLFVGVASGLVGLAYWPEDPSAIFNLMGSLIGYALYSGSISLIGDPHSAQAHYTIPWPLRIPQVCTFSAVLVWGAIGAPVQLLWNLRKRIGMRA